MKEIALERLQEMIVENCMFKGDKAAIGEETPLFGPQGLGLDSIDALQLVVAVERDYGVKLSDPAMAREALHSLGTLRDWLRRQP